MLIILMPYNGEPRFLKPLSAITKPLRASGSGGANVAIRAITQLGKKNVTSLAVSSFSLLRYRRTFRTFRTFVRLFVRRNVSLDQLTDTDIDGHHPKGVSCPVRFVRQCRTYGFHRIRSPSYGAAIRTFASSMALTLRDQALSLRS